MRFGTFVWGCESRGERRQALADATTTIELTVTYTEPAIVSGPARRAFSLPCPSTCCA
jgi:hypothetical protein